MLLEGVVVFSKLNVTGAPELLSFEVTDGEDVVEVRIPDGNSRNEMIIQVLDLKLGEKIDVYARVRDWEYEEDGVKKSKTVYFVRGITHYGR